MNKNNSAYPILEYDIVNSDSPCEFDSLHGTIVFHCAKTGYYLKDTELPLNEIIYFDEDKISLIFLSNYTDRDNILYNEQYFIINNKRRFVRAGDIIGIGKVILNQPCHIVESDFSRFDDTMSFAIHYNNHPDLGLGFTVYSDDYEIATRIVKNAMQANDYASYLQILDDMEKKFKVYKIKYKAFTCFNKYGQVKKESLNLNEIIGV